jgi:pimeloyl-ACP methyl ester carboxylesterase
LINTSLYIYNNSLYYIYIKMSLLKNILKNLIFNNLEVHDVDKNSDVYKSIKFISSTTSKSKIPYIYIQGKNENVIIYSHGNFENLFDIYRFLIVLSNATGCNVVSYDYEGYGLYYSNNKPTEESVYNEAVDVYMHVLYNYAYGDHQNIILIGRSIGSAPAIYSAFIFKDVKCLILISAFESIIKTKFSLDFGFDIFKNCKYITYINAPVLFIHGKKDNIVRVRNSENLFHKSKNYESKIVLIDTGDHNNLYTNIYIFEKIIDEIIHFI